MMILGIGTQIVISLWSIGVAVSQIAGIGNEAHRCSGGKFDFNWNYTSGVSILIVEWNVNVTTNVATHDLGGSQPFQPSASYTSRVTPLSDVGITLSSLAESDYGEYGCSVTNMNGITDLCTPLTLFVYDPWSEVLTISKTGGGDSVLLQSSINDDRTSYSWIYKDKEVGSGFKYKAIENGNYTLTLGKRGQCLTGGSSESIIVSEILGLTSPSSTISSDMSSTVSEPLSTMSTAVSKPISTINSDMPPTVSGAPVPPITTSAAELSQEILIAIVISSTLAAGLLILLVVLVVKQCRRKNKETPSKNKENHFANKQENLTKSDDLKSYKPRKSKVSKKRNTKRGSTSFDKKKDAQLKNFAPKDRLYQHYPQTTGYWSNYGYQHVFKNSNTEGNMMLYGNQHAKYLPPYSRPNNRMPYQSHHSDHIGHNEGMLQYYRADNMYRGQQMNQMQYIALKDKYMKDKPDSKRISDKTPYERNWDMLY